MQQGRMDPGSPHVHQPCLCFNTRETLEALPKVKQVNWNVVVEAGSQV